MLAEYLPGSFQHCLRPIWRLKLMHMRQQHASNSTLLSMHFSPISIASAVVGNAAVLVLGLNMADISDSQCQSQTFGDPRIVSLWIVAGSPQLLQPHPSSCKCCTHVGVPCRESSCKSLPTTWLPIQESNAIQGP
jgi:hypothetical protein